MAATKKIEDVVSVDVYTANGLLDIGHNFLDVRTPEEYNKSHVNGSVNVPYMFLTNEGSRVQNPEFVSQVSAIYKREDHLIVSCNSGGRGNRACVDLMNVGYEDVSNLEGGYSKWVDSGFAGDIPGDQLKSVCKFRP